MPCLPPPLARLIGVSPHSRRRSECCGCSAVRFSALEEALPRFPLIINTVPAQVLDAHALSLLRQDVLVLDLASKPGGDDRGDRCRKRFRMDKRERNWTIAIAGALTLTVGAGLAASARRSPDRPLTVAVIGTAAENSSAEAQHTEPSPLPETRSAANTAAETNTAQTTSVTAPDTNLNTADEAALRLVSGVGASLAQEIIRYREAHGGFRRRSELLEVPGIGEVLAGRIMARFVIPDELPELTAAEAPPVTRKTAADTDSETVQTETEAVSPADFFCDLNLADAETLARIPGVSREDAEAIVHQRETHGPFRSVYELALLENRFSGEFVRRVLYEYLYVEGDAVTFPREWQQNSYIDSMTAE